MKNAILGVLGALALLGCGGGGGGTKAATKARVAFVNASPDAGAIDFALDRSVEASAVAYGTATSFKEFKPKDYDAAVRQDGSDVDLWSEAHGFASDSDSLAVAVGLRTPPQDDTQTPPVVEEAKRLVFSFSGIDRSAPVGNRARLFVIHAFVRRPGYGTPAIDFRNPGNVVQVDSQNLAFGGIRAVDVDSGDQHFQVRQNGTEQVFVADTTLALAPAKIYIALVSGVEGTVGATVPKITLIPLETREK